MCSAGYTAEDTMHRIHTDTTVISVISETTDLKGGQASISIMVIGFPTR